MFKVWVGKIFTLLLAVSLGGPWSWGSYTCVEPKPPREFLCFDSHLMIGKASPIRALSLADMST